MSRRARIPGENEMRFKELETVVLNRDLAEHRLRKGDLGSVVHIYEPDGLEVEFVLVSGETVALVTPTKSDVRSVERDDLLAVRTLEPSES